MSIFDLNRLQPRTYITHGSCEGVERLERLQVYYVLEVSGLIEVIS
jgi:hypothetical protein